VSFEFRDKDPRASWKKLWDWANFLGSLIPAIVWGAAFTDLVHGVPMGPDGTYRGGLLGLLHPIALLGGLASCAVFMLHGAVFLSLKTDGALLERARRLAVRLSLPAAGLLAGTVVWVAASGRPAVAGTLPVGVPLAFAVVAVAGVLAAGPLVARGRSGLAFAANGLAILTATGAAFAGVFPSVFASSSIADHGLTIDAASSGHLTLVVMSVVAAIFTPVVLAYQGWTYWVFRQRLLRPVAPVEPPVGRLTAQPGDAPDLVATKEILA
jgi:cytochrome d ubiquinol oxidase subunit II